MLACAHAFMGGNILILICVHACTDGIHAHMHAFTDGSLLTACVTVAYCARQTTDVLGIRDVVRTKCKAPIGTEFCQDIPR